MFTRHDRRLCRSSKKKEGIILECDCVFCKIAKGDIPSATLYEDEDLRVILDLGPASKGHALVIPRKHAANLFELPDEIAEKAIVVAKKVAVRLKEGLHADGLNLVQNNGAAAGQTVDHFHIHLIPRYENDTVNVKWQPGTLSETDKEDILKLFQS